MAVAERLARSVATALVAVSCFALPAPAQDSPVWRALDLEDAGKWEEAAAAYRAELRGAESLLALFGLERALLTLNRGEELAAVLASLVQERPDDDAVRSMYVRTLLRLERRDAARAFVAGWIARAPLDPEAYRQLYSIGPLTADELRTTWRRLRPRIDSDSAQTVAAELIEHAFANGLWSSAQEVLEDLYRRQPSPLTAEQLALAAARSGDVARARAVAEAASLPESAAVRGWLALYDGDFATARALLAHAGDADAPAILPLALLSRTTSVRETGFGAGLLRLVRGDSSGAAREPSRCCSHGRHACTPEPVIPGPRTRCTRPWSAATPYRRRRPRRCSGRRAPGRGRARRRARSSCSKR